jgi:hypothetical protein
MAYRVIELQATNGVLQVSSWIHDTITHRRTNL